MNGTLKFIRQNLITIIFFVGLIGSWFVLKSTVSTQGQEIKELKTQTTNYSDRLARIEERLSMIWNLLDKKLK